MPLSVYIYSAEPLSLFSIFYGRYRSVLKLNSLDKPKNQDSVRDEGKLFALFKQNYDGLFLHRDYCVMPESCALVTDFFKLL